MTSDADREQWITQDDGLSILCQESKLTKQEFARKYRKEIDQAMSASDKPPLGLRRGNGSLSNQGGKVRIKGNWATREILVDDQRLDPTFSQKVWNHSPDGFSFGYSGSGCAQLALALLLHAGVNKDTAISMHQLLKEEFVAHLPQSDFEAEVVIRQDGTWEIPKPSTECTRPCENH